MILEGAEGRDDTMIIWMFHWMPWLACDTMRGW